MLSTPTHAHITRLTTTTTTPTPPSPTIELYIFNVCTIVRLLLLSLLAEHVLIVNHNKKKVFETDGESGREVEKYNEKRSIRALHNSMFFHIIFRFIGSPFVNFILSLTLSHIHTSHGLWPFTLHNSIVPNWFDIGCYSNFYRMLHLAACVRLRFETFQHAIWNNHFLLKKNHYSLKRKWFGSQLGET